MSGSQVSSHALARSSSVMRLRFSTADCNCSRNSCLDLTYRVIRGSGMELLHSGEVSDAGFWRKVAVQYLCSTMVLINVPEKVQR